MTSTHAAVGTAARRDIDRQLPDLCAALEQQRHFRLDQLDEIAEAAANSPPALDDARDHVTEILRSGACAALYEVDAALDRIRAGTYGTCEGCNRDIPLERLEILPMSRLCMRCRHAEQMRVR